MIDKINCWAECERKLDLLLIVGAMAGGVPGCKICADCEGKGVVNLEGGYMGDEGLGAWRGCG